MSMSFLSALQCIVAFLTYLFMTVIVPSIVFGKRFKRLDLNQRFLTYFTIGNFYMINIVFFLQLLHISNKLTLIIFTVVPAVIVWAHNNHLSVKERIINGWDNLNRIITGRLGVKTALGRFFSNMLKLFAKIANKIKEVFICNIIEWMLLVAFSAVFIKIFAMNMVTNFGYTASDIAVHNYWINELSKNNIFVAGIYPFGFHNVIYYLHEVFSQDTYVLLRVFCVVQTFFVDMMVLSLLKYCCKTKFVPYIGLFIYVVADILSQNTYSRFYSTLPQEFGMLFIYPCVYFACAFFKERKKELRLEQDLFGNPRECKFKKKQEKQIRKAAKQQAKQQGDKKKIRKKYFKLRVGECFSTWYLAGFAMSFSMTLAVHFYGTMIAGLFCVGIACGFLFRFIRPKYFWRVIGTFMIGMFIAIFPMAVAFMQGIPLQGSLGWGMSVIKGSDNDDEEEETDIQEIVSQSSVTVSATAAQVSGSGVTVSPAATTASGSGVTVSPAATIASKSGVTVSPAATTASESGVAVSPAATTASESGVAVSGASATVSKSGVAVSGASANVSRILFKKYAFSGHGDFVDGGKITLAYSSSHSFYDLEQLDYKRPISFFVNLLKKHPDRFVHKIKYVAGNIFSDIVDASKEFVFGSLSIQQIVLFYIMVLLLVFIGILMFLFKQYDYGAAIVSTTVFCGCMMLLLASGRIGLPMLMDPARCSIYFAYMVPLLIAFFIDSIIFIISGWLRWKWVKWVKHMVSFICLVVVVEYFYGTGSIREARYIKAFECNEAVTCLTNIIREEKDFTWTIVSANDEMRMGEDHGYHYEIIEFLRRMEGMGSNAMITIPTETIYFFIEKIPIDYPESYEGSGQKISEKGAGMYLPSSGGVSIYQKENRWIVMSRMYYWAQEFSKLYPNEMKVYMETDNFVCYKIRQNTYRLYNFAIDYGYNTQLYDFNNEDSEADEKNTE